MATLNRIFLEFLTRPGCHLCDDAAPAVRRAARALGGATVATIDIEQDDALVRDYGMRIPVVRVDGEVVAEGRFNAVEVWGRVVRHRLRG